MRPNLVVHATLFSSARSYVVRRGGLSIVSRMEAGKLDIFPLVDQNLFQKVYYFNTYTVNFVNVLGSNNREAALQKIMSISSKLKAV